MALQVGKTKLYEGAAPFRSRVKHDASSVGAIWLTSRALACPDHCHDGRVAHPIGARFDIFFYRVSWQVAGGPGCNFRDVVDYLL